MRTPQLYNIGDEVVVTVIHSPSMPAIKKQFEIDKKELMEVHPYIENPVFTTGKMKEFCVGWPFIEMRGITNKKVIL
jgi:hypothetical protein